MSFWWPPLGTDVTLRLEATSEPSLLLGISTCAWWLGPSLAAQQKRKWAGMGRPMWLAWGSLLDLSDLGHLAEYSRLFVG